MSIRLRFVLLIGMLSVLAAVALAFVSYRYSYNNAVTEAKKQGNMIVDFIEAEREFFVQEQRPLAMEIASPEQFYPKLMSGFAFNRGVWKHFAPRIPDFIFRQASKNPHYQPNRADEHEMGLIAEFAKNPAMATLEGITERGGSKYFYFAKPAKVQEKCLDCHGDPADAPKGLVKIYGSESGFHWSVGDTIATFVIYVPIQKSLQLARNGAIKLFLLGMAGIGLLMLVLWWCLNKYIVSPITMLELRATDISLGKNLNESVYTDSRDEISSLARSVDRLRVSMQKMLERNRNV